MYKNTTSSEICAKSLQLVKICENLLEWQVDRDIEQDVAVKRIGERRNVWGQYDSK